MSIQPLNNVMAENEDKEGGNLLGFVSDKASDLLLRKVFTEFNATQNPKTFNSGVQGAISFLRTHASPRILIVDIQNELKPLDVITKLATVCEPETRVIVIGTDASLDLYRDFKEMGVDDYLCKPLNQTQLVHAIGRASGQIKHQKTRSAKQIAITGCAGGVGVSTLVANLGRALSKQGAQTLITDMDCFGGDVDLLLDSTASFGLMNLLSEQNTIDKIFIERACQPVDERLYLLKSFGQRSQFKAENYQKLRSALVKEYNYLIWDLPSSLLSQQGISDTLATADIQLIVCAPTMASIRQCKALLSQIGERQYGQRTLLVLNHIHAPKDIMLTQVQMETSLGKKFDHILPYAPKVMLKSSELGQSILSRKHAVGRSLLSLSDDILGITKSSQSTFLASLSRLPFIAKKKTSNIQNRG